MRLLIITYAIDEAHPTLAWQAFVVRELAKQVEHLFVLTSNIGQTGAMPPNVTIITPPTRPMGVPHRFGGRFMFNREIYRLLKSNRVDAVFIHMAMEWAYLLKPAFFLLGLPVTMWYAHGTVTRRLRIATKLVNRVVTSTPEGCRIKDAKVKVIGQAINTRHFAIPAERALERVVYMGRISSRKRVELLYEVAKHMSGDGKDDDGICFDIIGATITQNDLRYEYGLRSAIWHDRMEKRFIMIGFAPYERIPEFYKRAFLHINVSQTGSMDKTVMEALCAGCPVLTSNSAIFEVIKEYPEFIIRDERPEAIAEQINYIYKKREEYDPVKLRALVENGHDLDSYASRVLFHVKQTLQ